MPPIIERFNLGSVPGPEDITRVALPNGVVVLARPNFNSPSVTISGYLPVGSLVDTDEKLGLASFVASALLRGTGAHDFQAIYDLLESVGASLGFSGGTHTAGFSGKALVEDIDLLLGILVEALRHPTFPSEQVERLRIQLLTGLALRAQNTAYMAGLAFDELVYENHPYSRPDEGHTETVSAITRQDLAAFHQQHYGPGGLVIAVVGGIDPQIAIQKVRAVFQDWQNPTQPPIPPLPELAPLKRKVQKRVDIPGKSQSDLIIGAAGPPRSAPDYLAAAVGNNILGRFGMMGRIGDVVREQAGLAYYAYSNLSGGLGPGPWSVSAGIDPTNEQQAIDLILQEIRRFVSEEVSQEELSDSQANYIGRLPLSLETNAGVAGALLNLERHNLPMDYYHQYPDLIRAITSQQVLAAAANYLHPEGLAIALAGPPVE